MVTVQAVNHETGVVQPVAEVVARAHAAAARVHVDAVQGWGKIAVPAGWDTAAVGPHKMRGPKGIGALAVRQGVRVDAVLLGGSRRRASARGPSTQPSPPASASLRASRSMRLRAGGSSLSCAIGSRASSSRSRRRMGAHASRRSRRPCPSRLKSDLARLGWRRARRGARPRRRERLERCRVQRGTVEPSPVLRAMIGDADGARGVRISIGDTTTEEDVAVAARAFRAVLTR